ncbi:MAG: single-stranded-DNA-specific exonuclease RecJ, partial [Saprospiraceae bacterium]
FSPFGPGNRRPIFHSKGVRDNGYSKVLKDAHLKLYIKQGNSKSIGGIGFWLGDKYEKVQQGEFDICYVMYEKTWKGRTSLELDVREVM